MNNLKPNVQTNYGGKIMEVKCKKTDCTHNNNTVCVAKEITIGDFQECYSFVEREHTERARKLNRFETSLDLTGHIHAINNKVNCNCKDCRFNDDFKCSCNGITLIDTGLCVSHIDK